MGFGGYRDIEYDSSSLIEKDATMRYVSSVPCKTKYKDNAPSTTPITVPKSSISSKMLCIGSNYDLDKVDIKDGTLVVNASSGEVFVGLNKKWEPITETRHGEYEPHGELKPMICTQCGGKIRNRVCTCCGTEFYFS